MKRAINQFKIAYNECENRKRVLISAPIFFSARRFAGHCCKVSDEAAFCLIQRPYISKTLL
ncbi:hypothetical protein ACOWX7_28535, partial [Klebsiella pneumoniae]